MDRRQVKYCILAVVVVIAGCSTTPIWNLNGRTQQDLDYAHALCDQVAHQQAAGVQGAQPLGLYAGVIAGINVLGQATMYNVAYNNCMQQNGFNRIN